MKEYKFKIGNQDYTAQVDEQSASALNVTVNGQTYQVEIPQKKAAAPRPAAPAAPAPVAAPKAAPAPAPVAAGANTITSPLPGTVTKFCVKVGDQVAAGQVVLTLEAMKMENEITAEAAGTVKSLLVEAGAQVQSGQALVELA